MSFSYPRSPRVLYLPVRDEEAEVTRYVADECWDCGDDDDISQAQIEWEAEAIKAELAAIAERSAQAKRTNAAAIALFHDMRHAGARVGRVNERTADGRFAVSDE